MISKPETIMEAIIRNKPVMIKPGDYFTVSNTSDTIKFFSFLSKGSKRCTLKDLEVILKQGNFKRINGEFNTCYIFSFAN